MIVFSRKYPIQRMLKKRFFKRNKLPFLRYGTIGLYCLYTFRLEYRYCLFLRKFFKRLFKRRKRKIKTFLKKKTWLFVRPNYTLTHKSKNARMGKGKGNFKRWCTIIYPGRIFIEHINVSSKTYIKYISKIKIKLKLKLNYLQNTSTFIKKPSIFNSVLPYTGVYDIIKLRKIVYTSKKKFNTYIYNNII